MLLIIGTSECMSAGAVASVEVQRDGHPLVLIQGLTEEQSTWVSESALAVRAQNLCLRDSCRETRGLRPSLVPSTIYTCPSALRPGVSVSVEAQY